MTVLQAITGEFHENIPGSCWDRLASSEIAYMYTYIFATWQNLSIFAILQKIFAATPVKIFKVNIPWGDL